MYPASIKKRNHRRSIVPKMRVTQLWVSQQDNRKGQEREWRTGSYANYRNLLLEVMGGYRGLPELQAAQLPKPQSP
jgi:hypothetical protein